MGYTLFSTNEFTVDDEEIWDVNNMNQNFLDDEVIVIQVMKIMVEY